MKHLFVLFTPLRYLLIRHTAKRQYDWLYPAVATAATLIAYAALPQRFSLVGEAGLLQQIRELVLILVGFNITALSVVSTLDIPSLKEEMAGTAPTLHEVDPQDGVSKLVALNRRRYVSYLFGYLAFISVLLYLIIMLMMIFRPIVTADFPVSLHWGRYLVLVIVAFPFWQMISVTFQGLVFLTDRIPK